MDHHLVRDDRLKNRCRYPSFDVVTRHLITLAGGNLRINMTW